MATPYRTEISYDEGLRWSNPLTPGVNLPTLTGGPPLDESLTIGLDELEQECLAIASAHG